MGRLNLHIDDKLEKRFRIYLAKKGYKKGDISKEIETMIEERLNKVKR